jgi:hypothetical protein
MDNIIPFPANPDNDYKNVRAWVADVCSEAGLTQEMTKSALKEQAPPPYPPPSRWVFTKYSIFQISAIKIQKHIMKFNHVFSGSRYPSEQPFLVKFLYQKKHIFSLYPFWIVPYQLNKLVSLYIGSAKDLNDKKTATYWFELLESVSPIKLNQIKKFIPQDLVVGTNPLIL